mmetsp:Transcript_33572/g.86790  ORF Transcript_33572/g.86790 Transcript_33572/m.86790 type:complete len:231 (-) Transcript_33572:110-802(-)
MNEDELIAGWAPCDRLHDLGVRHEPLLRVHQILLTLTVGADEHKLRATIVALPGLVNLGLAMRDQRRARGVPEQFRDLASCNRNLHLVLRLHGATICMKLENGDLCRPDDPLHVVPDIRNENRNSALESSSGAHWRKLKALCCMGELQVDQRLAEEVGAIQNVDMAIGQKTCTQRFVRRPLDHPRTLLELGEIVGGLQNVLIRRAVAPPPNMDVRLRAPFLPGRQGHDER